MRRFPLDMNEARFSSQPIWVSKDFDSWLNIRLKYNSCKITQQSTTTRVKHSNAAEILIPIEHFVPTVQHCLHQQFPPFP